MDLVDGAGVIQVKNVPRDEIHRYPHLHAQIALAVVWGPDGTLLMQKRSQKVRDERGALNLACGMIATGDDPYETVLREIWEETTVVPDHVQLVRQGLNAYSRYEYLFCAVASAPVDEARVNDPGVEWARYLSEQEIRDLVAAGMPFCRGTFDDIELTRPVAAAVRDAGTSR